MLKKQTIQICFLLFIFYLYLFFLGNLLIFYLFSILLLSALYIFYNNKNHKFGKYLRIILYFILLYFVYNFLYYLPINVHVLQLYGNNSIEIIQRLFFDCFWGLLYILIISAVLIFNKPTNPIKFNIWKFQFSI
jgi:hypothetical protein